MNDGEKMQTQIDQEWQDHRMALKLHAGFLAIASGVLSLASGLLYLAARLSQSFLSIQTSPWLEHKLLQFSLYFIEIAGFAALWVFVVAPVILMIWRPFWELRYRTMLIEQRLTEVEDALAEMKQIRRDHNILV